MSNRWIYLGILLICVGTAAQGQTTPNLLNGLKPMLDLSTDSKPASTSPEAVVKPQAGATEITATHEASFDQQTRQAVFTGNVKVKHPQFTLTAQKLIAVLKKEATHAAKPAESPVHTPDLPGSEGGLEKVIAEGEVVIIQDKPTTDGGTPTRYVAKAARAEYDAATGNVTLSGWPQVSQGINMQVATESSTVMILNKDGKMTTSGGSKTLIQDTEKKTPRP